MDIRPHFDSRYLTILTLSSGDGSIFSGGSKKSLAEEEEEDEDEDVDNNDDEAAKASETTVGNIDAGAPRGGSKPISISCLSLSSTITSLFTSLLVLLLKFTI